MCNVLCASATVSVAQPCDSQAAGDGVSAEGCFSEKGSVKKKEKHNKKRVSLGRQMCVALYTSQGK